MAQIWLRVPVIFIFFVLMRGSVLASPGLAPQEYVLAETRSHLSPWIDDKTQALIGDVASVSDEEASCKLLSPYPILGEGFGSDPNLAYVPSTGVLQAYMIFVDFEDAPASERTTDLYLRYMPAASEWYRNFSFGRLNLRVMADFSQFHRMPRDSAKYDFRRGRGRGLERMYVQDALDAVGEKIKFAGTDLLYIVPTKEAVAITYSPTFMVPIQAHDGTLISKTVTFGQDVNDFGFKLMNHETGHTMGLPDLYSYQPHTRAGVYVGGYDLMAQIEGISPDYLAWHKWRLGWVDDEQIICIDPSATKSERKKYTLTPVEEATGVKALVFRHNASFALVAENRSGRNLDSDTCGTGVLIYTVSTTTPSGRGPIRVQDSSPGSGCAGDRFNDGLFVPKPQTRSSFTSIDLGVRITVLEQVAEDFTVELDFL